MLDPVGTLVSSPHPYRTVLSRPRDAARWVDLQSPHTSKQSTTLRGGAAEFDLQYLQFRADPSNLRSDARPGKITPDPDGSEAELLMLRPPGRFAARKRVPWRGIHAYSGICGRVFVDPVSGFQRHPLDLATRGPMPPEEVCVVAPSDPYSHRPAGGHTRLEYPIGSSPKIWRK